MIISIQWLGNIQPHRYPEAGSLSPVCSSLPAYNRWLVILMPKPAWICLNICWKMKGQYASPNLVSIKLIMESWIMGPLFNNCSNNCSNNHFNNCSHEPFHLCRYSTKCHSHIARWRYELPVNRSKYSLNRQSLLRGWNQWYPICADWWNPLS